MRNFNSVSLSHLDELHLALVLSTKPHARIVSVDAARALEMAGVVAFFSAKDVPGQNRPHPFPEEEIFATDTVLSCIWKIRFLQTCTLGKLKSENSQFLILDIQFLLSF